jgi:hypothetical protein
MTWAGGELETAADALWVDEYLLAVRLGSLAGRERGYVNQWLTIPVP